MFKIGSGSKTFFVVAEVVHMGTRNVNIKLTDNEAWAKQNQIIGKLKADTEEQAKSYFRIIDMTR